jgi:hypothetical protein
MALSIVQAKRVLSSSTASFNSLPTVGNMVLTILFPVGNALVFQGLTDNQSHRYRPIVWANSSVDTLAYVTKVSTSAGTFTVTSLYGSCYEIWIYEILDGNIDTIVGTHSVDALFNINPSGNMPAYAPPFNGESCLMIGTWNETTGTGSKTLVGGSGWTQCIGGNDFMVYKVGSSWNGLGPVWSCSGLCTQGHFIMVRIEPAIGATAPTDPEEVLNGNCHFWADGRPVNRVAA